MSMFYASSCNMVRVISNPSSSMQAREAFDGQTSPKTGFRTQPQKIRIGGTGCGDGPRREPMHRETALPPYPQAS